MARSPRTLAFSFGGAAVDAPEAPYARTQLALALAIAPLVAVTLWLGANSDHLRRPVAAALYWSYLIAASMGTGLYWWRRRPTSRFGPLLVLFGLGVWLVSWQGSNTPVLFDIGVLAEGPFFVLTIYLFLAFPVGRLEPPAAAWLVYAIVAAVVAFFLPWALFSPVIAGGGPLTGCAPNCPPNALQIGTAPDLVDAAGKLETYVSLTVVAGVVVVYGRRALTASRPQRRALMAVAVTSLLFLPAYFIHNFCAWVLHVDPSVSEKTQWLVVGTRVLLPLGFLIALLQARGFAARAQQALLERLAARPSPERWRDAVAEAVDDPTLRLGYYDLVSGTYLEPGGERLERPSSRAWVTVARGRQPVAAMAIEEALAEDPELVRGAASATLVAVENGALETLALEATRAERERIGRDLHDSAQQRLIALRIRLALFSEELGGSEEVDRLGDEIDQTLSELRDIANGVTPAVLAERGVGPALEAVARRTPIRVSVFDSGIGRPPEDVETAIYFCCLESLQNAAKHAGPDPLVSIHLARDGGHVSFSIEDDGIGFDPAVVATGAGLGNIAGRVAAVGGQLEVHSRAGLGTRVSGAVPL